MPHSASSLLFRLQQGAPVCLAVAGDSLDQLFARAEDALRASLLVELRLDALPDPAQAVARLGALAQASPRAILLATCRRVAGGGGFAGEVAQQLALLESYAQAGAATIDLELETLEATDPERLRQFGDVLAQQGCALVVSAHDFQTAADPEAVLAKLRRLAAPARPSIYKVVNTAGGLADNLATLHAVAAHAGDPVPVTGICMGAAGLPSRVLALRAGAPFTFAALDEAGATAPGQVPVAAMLGRYRADRLRTQTEIYGVAGNPVGHSFSPAIHNAAFQAAGYDAVYLPLHTEAVDDLLRLARALPLHGLSVTMPWKTAILPLLDSLAPLAKRIGAVNTVTRLSDGSLHGSNTDAAAIVQPLAKRLPLAGARVLLAGAGGAARAAAFALVEEGAHVAILNRTPDAARALAEASGALVADTAHLAGYDVILNATPMGMAGPHAAECPVPPEALDGVRVVFDMVYRPRITPLVRAAQLAGIELVDGLEMFTHQAAAQWHSWTGDEPPAGVMRAALETALQSA